MRRRRLGTEVKGMVSKETKEKEHIDKSGHASSIGRELSSCLHLSPLRVRLTVSASSFSFARPGVSA
jgi:hypothetical protein